MGGGVLSLRGKSFQYDNFGVGEDEINKYSAFSLIELSIVLIIMGLLVAGVTGGANMIENAKVTSLKKEVDSHIMDIFTFYARTGRLPGDLDNSGKIGYQSDKNPYPVGSFSEPYNLIEVGAIASPFVELYLYGVSSFKPDPSDSNMDKNNLMASTIMPYSKIYKGFGFFHRYAINDESGGNSYFLYQLTNKTTMDILTTKGGIESGVKIMSVVKKIEFKFDDGNHNIGNIRGFCHKDGSNIRDGAINYNDADICHEIVFVFDVK